ncbi:MAG: RNA polymerase sigma factor [Flavobacteriaceae bacterium]|nr:RNA polymerase sigma factor [Flavobacteriaceae bacterium]
MMSIEEYKEEFTKFHNQLMSYIYRLVTHRQEAEDIAQDTYIKTFQNIDNFKGKSTFKTWVFAIATNLAKDNNRAKERWGNDWMNLVKDAHVADPELFAKKKEKIEDSTHGKFVLSEHLNYCFNCTSKTLLLKQQICLWLKEVYNFKISEIMLILDLSEGKVKHSIANARKAMAEIFEKKCVLINKKGTCSQCTGLNNMFNPQQDAHIEANKIKMVKEQNGKNYEQLLDLRLQLVKSIDPLEGESIELHNYLIENSPAWAKQQKALKTIDK